MICALVYSKHDGLSTQIPVGLAEGLKKKALRKRRDPLRRITPRRANLLTQFCPDRRTRPGPTRLLLRIKFLFLWRPNCLHSRSTAAPIRTCYCRHRGTITPHLDMSTDSKTRRATHLHDIPNPAAPLTHRFTKQTQNYLSLQQIPSANYSESPPKRPFLASKAPSPRIACACHELRSAALRQALDAPVPPTRVVSRTKPHPHRAPYQTNPRTPSLPTKTKLPEPKPNPPEPETNPPGTQPNPPQPRPLLS